MPHKKLTGPILSLGASGRLGKALAVVRRLGGPVGLLRGRPSNPNTDAQASWRTKFQQAITWWHQQSAADKLAWERLGTQNHMTGYAYFMSMALAPNPGIYLPLLGGTMQGDIDTDGNRITGLNPAVLATEPVVLSQLPAAGAPTMLDPDVSVLTLIGQSASVGWTAVDLTALTSADCRVAILNYRIQLTAYTSGFVRMEIRTAGGSHLIAASVWATDEPVAQDIHFAQAIVGLDASQEFEYSITISATATATFIISLAGWWP